MKNAYKQLFYAKQVKHQSTQSIKHSNVFRYHIVYIEINQNIAGEGLNCVLNVIPLDMFFVGLVSAKSKDITHFFVKTILVQKIA